MKQRDLDTNFNIINHYKYHNMSAFEKFISNIFLKGIAQYSNEPYLCHRLYFLEKNYQPTNYRLK